MANKEARITVTMPLSDVSFLLGGPNLPEPVRVTGFAVIRTETGYAARGITRDGRIVRVPIPGATLDGNPLPRPSPDEQRDLAPERSPIHPGKPKASPPK